MTHWETFKDYNQTGIDGLLTYPASIMPEFIPLVLIALFSFTFLSIFFGQKRLTGRGDLITAFTSSSIFITIIAFMMTMIDGLINISTLLTCIGITVVSIIVLFISSDRN